ncbi:MAG: VanW family protein [Gaiellaceae bacterium]
MAASSSAVRVRRRAPARSRFWSRLAILAVIAAVIAIGIGLVFAGSGSRLADGTRIAGIDVGGLTASDARGLLERRSASLATVPVRFTVGSRTFRITPRQLDVRVDWRAAVANAEQHGGGFGFVRGYRRLGLEFFPQNLDPPTQAYQPALSYKLDLFGRAVNRPHREAKLVRRGLHITIAAGATGQILDRAAARELIVHSLASFSRAPVELPVRTDAPSVTVATLTAKQRTASRIVSAPVTVVATEKRLRVPRWELAKMLDLHTLRFGGPAAQSFFARLEGQVERPPKDADWAADSDGRVRIVPSQVGVALDVSRSAERILAAATRDRNRVATLELVTEQPKRTTAAAEAMGITGTVGAYETFYGGVPNRIHNVQLVAHLVDHKLIAPGTTFSFNGTTGERSAAKGFLEAPVIVNGELQTGLGGGVCQVSTTVFNAAYEAGLPITARTNHALYISHYPLGRDATVDYPSTDLKFVNDTGHWLLLRTWVGASSLTVALYGAPQHRRVVSVAAPLRTISPPPVRKTIDATLDPGQVVVDEYGVPAQATSVERKVYAPDGKLLSDSTWYSSYVAEPKVIRVGPKKPKAASPSTTTTATTTTATTTTESAPAVPH